MAKPEQVGGGAPLSALSLAAFTVAERRLTLPDTSVDLVWAGGRVTLLGPMSRARPTRMPVGTRALLLSLDPLVAAAWLKTPLDLLTDRVLDLAEIDPRGAAAMTDRFGTGRVRDLVGAAAPEGRLAFAARALTQGMRVSRVAAAVGLSERQLERSFHRATGLAPKRFARIVRLRRAVEAAKRGAGLAAAAHDAGYADQAHFSREVKALTGVTPLQALPYVGNVQDLSGAVG